MVLQDMSLSSSQFAGFPINKVNSRFPCPNIFALNFLGCCVVSGMSLDLVTTLDKSPDLFEPDPQMGVCLFGVVMGSSKVTDIKGSA